MYCYVRLPLNSYLEPVLMCSALDHRDGRLTSRSHSTYLIFDISQNDPRPVRAWPAAAVTTQADPSLLYSRATHDLWAVNRGPGVWGPVCVRWKKLWESNTDTNASNVGKSRRVEEYLLCFLSLKKNNNHELCQVGRRRSFYSSRRRRRRSRLRGEGCLLGWRPVSTGLKCSVICEHSSGLCINASRQGYGSNKDPPPKKGGKTTTAVRTDASENEGPTITDFSLSLLFKWPTVK